MKSPRIPFVVSAILCTACGLGVAVPSVQAAPNKKKKKELPAVQGDALSKIEAALPSKASAKPAKPRRVLVFWKCEGFFHGGGIAAGNKAIELMGPKTGAFQVDVSDDYAVFEPSNLAKYDAIILNNTTKLKIPDDGRKQAFLDFVRNGKGLVGIHAASDNFYNWPEAAKMMGGLFDGHPWGGGGTWAFKLDAPDHVLTKAFGGNGFKLKDEI